MNDVIKLKKIANISSGYPFRASLNKISGVDIRVIQAKDIKDGVVDSRINAVTIADQGFKTSSFVRKDDVLLSARGNMKTGIIDRDISNTIASSSVYIIRIISDKIIPEFLSIYLNSRMGQKQLSERATGAVISTILKSDLENIEVGIPNLEKQQQIINIYKNNLSQQALLQKKQKIINVINEALINKLIIS